MIIKGIEYEAIPDYDKNFNPVSNYAILLNTLQWKNKSRQIIANDGNHCSRCNAYQTINLNGSAHSSQFIGNLLNGKPLYSFIPVKEHISLHAHHTYYVLERYPWNYKDNELITLCNSCHSKEHLQAVIPVFLTEDDKLVSMSPNLISCPRCGGDGYISEYNYYQRGICFACLGNCFIRVKSK